MYNGYMSGDYIIEYATRVFANIEPPNHIILDSLFQKMTITTTTCTIL